MRIIELNGCFLQRSQEGHCYLKQMMDFPDYYGNNLDALYDLLTEIKGPVEIHIVNSEKMDLRMKKVFESASEENKDMNIFLTK